VFHYLDVLDALGLDRPHVVGASFGGWIAAELALYLPQRVASLTLLSAAGLRLPEHPVTDLFLLPPARLPETLFHNPPPAQRYAERIPNATYTEVPDCGHAMYFERPAEFTARVAAFLNAYPLTTAESGVSR